MSNASGGYVGDPINAGKPGVIRPGIVVWSNEPDGNFEVGARVTVIDGDTEWHGTVADADDDGDD